LVVIVGTVGLLATLLLNRGTCLWLAFRSNGPAFPPNFDQRFLILAAWGFMVPFVWGFNAKWLPVFLGTGPPQDRLLGAAVAVQVAGIGLGLAGLFRATTALLLGASLDVEELLRRFLALTSIFGCIWPARRAATLDPMKALRTE
jgi:uncharacterized protein involved in response to NO